MPGPYHSVDRGYRSGRPWRGTGSSPDFSTGTMDVRREGQSIFQVLKEKDCQPRILLPEKMFFKNKRGIMAFSGEGKLIKGICHQETFSKGLRRI